MAGIDTIIFDKTGTLTEGRPQLVNVDELPAGALELAAKLARTSRHPLSRAVADAAGMGEAAPDVSEIAGGGLEAEIDGGRVRFGAARWLGVEESSDPHTEAWLLAPDAEPVRFRFEDRLRPDAATTLTSLREAGLEIELLSGDREGPVREIASRLALDDWKAGLKPQDKIARIKALRDQGRTVAMVGDGINDAPALAAADVSISVASAAEISQAASDLVLQGHHLAPVRVALDMSRQAKQRVLENFGLAVVYNMIAVPLAVGGFVTPMIAAIAMSASSILVTLNALRLAKQ
jgi:Cu2+-exporting ATPase